jgi:hypothetical protein
MPCCLLPTMISEGWGILTLIRLFIISGPVVAVNSGGKHGIFALGSSAFGSFW